MPRTKAAVGFSKFPVSVNAVSRDLARHAIASKLSGAEGT
jgi:hypothetical protein